MSTATGRPIWRRALGALRRRLLHVATDSAAQPDKYAEEARFWSEQIPRLVDWLAGETAEHYRTPAPRPEEVVAAATTEQSAIRTWFELHQKPKYLVDLALEEGTFAGERLLDIGCGPYPSAEVFSGCEVHCLDPLLPVYRRAGYPLTGYASRTRWLCGHSERIPLADDSIDAVISVNAIDHVDDFVASAQEIGRVLKPGGRLRLHIHYHPPTATEPLELDDRAVRDAFSWCPTLHKVSESDRKSSAVARTGETYALWSSF